MKRLILAFRAFWKAFKQPEWAALVLAEPVATSEKMDRSHLQLLNALQESGRLVDFLKEDVSAFNDAQIGAAVRKIHHDCAEVLEELVSVRPLKDEQEGAVIQIPKGYNPEEIRLIGNIKGEPPFRGVIVHRGWKAHKCSLPKQMTSSSCGIISPVEVEIRVD